MPLLNVTFKSYVLEMTCNANVILPQSSPDRIIRKPYKTLYLLHGLSDDHTAWTSWTSIERYATEYDIAVIMPNVHRSFYADWDKMQNGGRKYFTFVSEELISIMQDMFHLSDKREDRYAAGLSMGGYGAMKLGLSCPEKFTAVASLSGALDIIYRLYTEEWTREEFKDVWSAPQEELQKNDLFKLAEKLNDSNKPKPRIYMWCGTEDFLYQDNVKFRDFIKNMDYEIKYEESKGDHLWGYWDSKIQSALKFMFTS